MNDVIDYAFAALRWLLIVAVVLIIGGALCSLSPSISLNKNEWKCSSFHEYVAVEPVLSGKTSTMQNVYHRECIQWSHL